LAVKILVWLFGIVLALFSKLCTKILSLALTFKFDFLKGMLLHLTTCLLLLGVNVHCGISH